MSLLNSSPIMLDYRILNDPESEVYMKAHQRTKNYIDNKLPRSRLKYFRNKTGLTNEDGIDGLVAHLTDNAATNCIKNFFRFNDIKECEVCGVSSDKPLDRAHCNHNGVSRPLILKRAIEHYYTDVNTPVKVNEIMRKFIELHGEMPLYMLCKKCHKEYDKKNDPS